MRFRFFGRDEVGRLELEPIFLHASIEGAAAESQGLCRLRYIALKTLQGFANQHRFHGFEA